MKLLKASLLALTILSFQISAQAEALYTCSASCGGYVKYTKKQTYPGKMGTVVRIDYVLNYTSKTALGLSRDEAFAKLANSCNSNLFVGLTGERQNLVLANLTNACSGL